MYIIYRMRLIRLTTETNDGRFDCDFNEDLVIPPNSQIALHSFTTQFPSATIVVNSLNNELSYSLDGDDNIKTIVLPIGTYSNANIQEFFSQTTQRLNASVAYQTGQIGKQWRAGIFGGKTDFSIKRGLFRTISIQPNQNNSFWKNVANVSDDPATEGNRYQRDGGNMASNDAFIYWNLPIVKSSGYIRQKVLVDSTVPTNNGFIIGLTSVCPDVATTSINPTNLEYGVRYTSVGEPYYDIVDGVSSQSAVMGALNDIINIIWAENGIVYRVTRENGDTETIRDTTFNHLTDYFPLVVFNGDCILANTNIICDPYYSPTTTDNMTPTEEEELGAKFYPAVKTDNFFEFNTATLAQEFGYFNARIPETGFVNTINYSYIGDNAFILRDYSETYIVELLNIQLNSMDAMTKQHKNYLAVVPHLQDLRELVVYVSPILIFLDLNNKFPLSYRQIKARILRDDLTSVTTYGLSQMAILIKSSNE
jgi:hypothetical protein